MIHRILLYFFFLFTLGTIHADVSSHRYAMVYFHHLHDEQTKTDTYSFHVALSNDGYHWENLEGVKSPRNVGDWNVIRDPSFIQDSEGKFHVFWTTSNNAIGYANSANLKTWQNERMIPINVGILKGENAFTWAPEAFYDPLSKQYMIVFSTAKRQIGEGWNGDFRTYYITTTDFTNYSEPTPLFHEELPYREIDGALIYHRDRYHYFFKIEDSDLSTIKKEKGGIRHRSAPSLQGPWTDPTPDMLPGNLPNSEGPSPVLMTDGSIIVYYDKTGKLKAARSQNLDENDWKCVTDQLVQPRDFRHGTVRELLKPSKNPE